RGSPRTAARGRRGAAGSQCAYDAGGVAGDHRAVRDVVRDDASRADDRLLTDGDAAQDRRAGADRRAPPHEWRLAPPVGGGLQRPRLGRRARIPVVDEDHAVPDEDLVLERHALADEAVARDLAAPANDRVLLDLDEGPDLRLVPDAAAVEVDEVGEGDVVAE